MKHIFWIDLKRGLKIRWIFLSVTGLVIAGIYGMRDVYETLVLNDHMGGGMIFFHFAQTGSSSSAYLYLIPLMAVIPFSSSLRDDIKSGFFTYLIPRCGTNGYFASKLLISCMIGGIISLVSTLVLYLGYWCVFPPGELEIQDFMMYTTEYLLIAGRSLSLGMLYAGFWSLAGTVAAVWMEDKFVGMGVPFILSYILVAFQERYYEGFPYLNPHEWASPVMTNGWADFFLLTGLISITGIISFRWLKRRLL